MLTLNKYIFPLAIMLVLFTSCKSGKGNKTTSSSSKKNNENSKINAVIKTARNFTGTPYQYGGTSRAGMDCSGLTSQAFKSIDIALPRTSIEQSKVGETIKLSEIHPGDLIFFTDKKGHKKITHVGIITEVKGPNDAKFIHASTKLGVVENDLYANYYKELIIKAVRVF